MTEQLKHNAWKYLGSLFMEVKDGHRAMSLGRLAFCVMLIQAQWIWSGFSDQADLPTGQMTVLLALLAYITGSKAIDKLRPGK